MTNAKKDVATFGIKEITQIVNAKQYEIDGLGDVKPRLKLGGSVASKFVPNINASFFDDEFYFNLNRKDKIVTTQTALLASGKVSQKIDTETDEYYIDADGNFKWDIVFDSEPAKMDIVWDMEYSDGIEFYYQPELTSEEILKGTIRPNNVIGSYAVYCSKSNNKYKTGKVCHIYRPFVIDANNQKEWAKIEIKNKKLTITLPESFMQTAVYPVRLDPAFGYDTLGASVDNYWSNLFLSNNTGSPAGDGSLTKLAIACYNAGSGYHVKLAIYADDTDLPDALVDSAGSIDITHTTKPSSDTATWDSGVVSADILAADTYHIAMDQENNSTYIAYDTVAGIGRAYGVNYASFPPDPAETASGNSYRWSMFAEYTSGGGTTIDLSSSIINTSNIADTLVKMRGYSSTFNNTSNLSPTLAKMRGLSANLPTASNLIGTLISETIIELTAILPSISNAIITLARIREISATLNNTLNVVGALISESYIELVAALSNELNVSTFLVKERGMSAILQNASNISMLLTKIRELTATLNNTSNVSGILHRILTLLAILNSTLNINATLTTTSNLTAETQNIFGFIHVENTIGKVNITDNIFAFMKVDPEITIGELHAG